MRILLLNIIQMPLYPKTASRPEGGDDALWLQHMTYEWATLLHTHGMEGWPGAGAAATTGLSAMGSARSGCRWRHMIWPESNRADKQVNKGESATKGLIEKQNRGRYLSECNRAIWCASSDVFPLILREEESQSLLIIGWNCLVSVVIMVQYLQINKWLVSTLSEHVCSLKAQWQPSDVNIWRERQFKIVTIIKLFLRKCILWSDIISLSGSKWRFLTFMWGVL